MSRNSSCSRLLLLLGLAASLFAQPSAGLGQSDAKPDGQPASISGVVTDSVTAAPIERAHVLLRSMMGSQESYGTLTDRDGKFTVTSIPAGRYAIALDKPGFVSPPGSFGGQSNNLNLRAGDKTDGLKFKMTPSGSISGRVLDPDGEPLENYNVRVSNGNGEMATTDEKGHFRLGGLAPGKYTVQASGVYEQQLPPEIRTDGTMDRHLASTYFPGVLDLKSAQRVEVSPGAELTGIDIRLIATPIVSVSGIVKGIPARAEAAVQARRPSPNNEPGNQGDVKADGSFRIWRLDPGKYNLIAEIQNQAGRASMQSAPFEITVAGADLEHIELRLIPPFDLTGQIVFDDSAARNSTANPSTPTTRSGQRRWITARSDVNAGYYGGYQQGEIAADDSFTMENVQAGQYHLSISGSGAFVKSVRQGSTETEGDVLDVRNGSAGAITVTLSSNGAQISGTVSDSNGPVAGARVSLRGESANPRSAVTDKSGVYHMSNLPPGKYKILAADNDAMQNIQADDDEGEALELHAGDTVTKDLTKK